MLKKYTAKITAILSLLALPLSAQAESVAPDSPPPAPMVVDAGALKSATPARVKTAVLIDGVLSIQAETREMCDENAYNLMWDGKTHGDPPKVHFTLGEEQGGDCQPGLIGVHLLEYTFANEQSASLEVNGVSVTDGAPPLPPAAPVKIAPAKDIASAPADAFSIEAIRKKGPSLEVDVAYSGGCGSHDFVMYWDGVLKKSNPPKASLTLSHNANGDTCEAMFSETLRFDLTGQLGLSVLTINGQPVAR